MMLAGLTVVAIGPPLRGALSIGIWSRVGATLLVAVQVTQETLDVQVGAAPVQTLVTGSSYLPAVRSRRSA